MPTGYTARLYDGKPQSFEEFALECARAFGALVSLRDDMEAPIPETFEPSDHHSKALTKALAELVDVRAMRETACDERARQEYERALEERSRGIQTSDARRQRYEAMLAAVRRWTPPTADHDGLKKFMVEQIEGSIRFDCSSSIPEPVRRSGLAWRDERIAHLNREIDYHTKEHAEEVERARGRTAWVAALRGSLR